MANDKKFVTKNGLHTNNIDFVANDASGTITAEMIDGNTLSFSGDAGQLFSITDSMDGVIHSVTDISGIPSLEIYDTGTVRIAEYDGNVLIGTDVDNGTDKLQVDGAVSATQIKSTVATGTAPLVVASTTLVTDLNADQLDGQHGSFYQNASNLNAGTIADARMPAIISASTTGNAATATLAADATKLATARTITIDGDVVGSVSFDGSANVTLTAAVANNSHTHNSMVSVDDRDVKPNVNIDPATVKAFFTSKTGLDTPTAGSDYGDLIVLNTYSDGSGGKVNALFFRKNTPEIFHYQGTFNGTTWDAPKQLAYTTSDITGNAATATKLQTARTINGVSFDGTANITVADATKLPLTGGTLSSRLIILGSAGTKPLQTRGIVGDTGAGVVADLYLQYGANSRVYLGDTGAHYITADGGTYTGNAATATLAADATKLATARNITLSGDVTGTGTFDGSGDLNIAVTVYDDAHDHVISNVDGLQTALDDLQTGINGKQATITGAATTITGANLTVSRALISDASGKVAVSSATSTELSYLSGVTSAVQTQLNGKLGSTANAVSATKLVTARTINGVSFDGTANITINAVDATARIASSEKGVANGVATLGADGKVPTAQLPSYVDDVLEYANLAAFPATGEAGKIYIDLSNNKTYRWSGTVYVYITSGAVDSVAGKTGVVTLVKGDVGLGSVDNTADSAKNVLSATKLTTARTIAGVSFDGTANIAIPFNNLTSIPTEIGYLTGVTSAIQTQINSKLDSSSYTAADVLAKLVTVDGSTSGVDADMLDGQHGSYYLDAANMNAGILPVARLSGTYTGASIGGNSATATKLATARSINGVNFDGSANIMIPSLYDGAYKRITNPGGAEYTTNLSSATGALAITLPVGMANSMVRMTIKIYEYATNESFEVHCGGYTYSSGNTWTNNPFAYIVGNPNIDRRFTVRFGYTAGGKGVIYIGELASTWSYPQVYVTDVQIGYGSQSVTWTSGWSIGVQATAFENVTATISNCQVGYAVSTNTASSVVLRDASGNFSAGTITATGFTGSGANLTALNGSNISTGTVAAARLPAATTAAVGAVQLNDTVASTSTTQAATANAVKTVNDSLTTHKSSTDHDGRYYTKAEIDAMFSNTSDEDALIAALIFG